MSRTTRRTKDGQRPYWLYKTYKRNDEGIWGSYPKDPEVLVKDVARYHSDKDHHNSANKWFRTKEHNEIKMLVKEELARFWKDPEKYEVQIDRRKKHDWWD